jgi:hypothetical protein
VKEMLNEPFGSDIICCFGDREAKRESKMERCTATALRKVSNLLLNLAEDKLERF